MPASWTRAQNGSNARIGRGAQPLGGEDRPVADGDDAGAAVEAPLELAHGSVEVGQGQERDREDPVLIGEAPVLVEPAVEGPQHLDGGLDVGLHRALHADALRREQPRRLDALGVHAGQAGVTVEPLGVRGGILAGQLVADPLLAALAGEVVVERPGAGAGVDVARSGDDRMGPLPEEVAGLAVDLPQNDTAVGELRVAVAGEGVAGLPVVIVGVEERPDLGFGGAAWSPPQSVPWRSSLPGVASVHSPSTNVVTPFTMIRS